MAKYAHFTDAIGHIPANHEGGRRTAKEDGGGGVSAKPTKILILCNALEKWP